MVETVVPSKFWIFTNTFDDDDYYDDDDKDNYDDDVDDHDFAWLKKKKLFIWSSPIFGEIRAHVNSVYCPKIVV